MFASVLAVVVLSASAPHTPLKAAQVEVLRMGRPGGVVATSSVGNLAVDVPPRYYEIIAYAPAGGARCDETIVNVTRHERVRRVQLHC